MKVIEAAEEVVEVATEVTVEVIEVEAEVIGVEDIEVIAKVKEVEAFIEIIGGGERVLLEGQEGVGGCVGARRLLVC